MTKVRVLELGIGRGGPYISRDKKGTERVGLDYNLEALAAAKETYGIVTYPRNILLEGLAFPERHFDSLQTFFPSHHLLQRLTSGRMSLWPELYRVTKPGAQVQAIVDVPKTGYW